MTKQKIEHNILFATAIIALIGTFSNIQAYAFHEKDKGKKEKKLTVDDYIKSLGDATFPNKSETIKSTGEAFSYTNADGVDITGHYEVNTENRSYHEIISLDPNSNVVWAGNIVQGLSIQIGTLAAINLPRKSGIVTLTGVSFTDDKPNSVVVKNPKESTVKDAVEKLLRRTPKGTVAGFSYTSDYYESKEQAMILMGLSAEHPFGELNAQLASKKSASTSTYFVKLVQKYYSVSFEDPSSPGSVFSKSVKPSDLEPYTGKNNLPAMITNVTYGRIIILSFETHAERQEFQAALNTMFSAFIASGSFNVSNKSTKLLNQSRINIYAVGGSAGKVAKVITGSGELDKVQILKKYIDDGSEVSDKNLGAPIAYKAIYLKDNTPAALNSSYSFRKPVFILPSYKMPLTFEINKLKIFDVCDDDEDLDFGYTATFIGQNGRVLGEMSNERYAYVEEPSKLNDKEVSGVNTFFEGERKTINAPVFKIEITVWAKTQDGDSEPRPWISKRTKAVYSRTFYAQDFGNPGVFRPWDRMIFDFTIK